MWDEITVALILPPAEGDEEPPSLDGVIEQASKSMREGGQSFETLQRQQRTVDHKPAQMLKVRYHEKATDRDWVEEMVFIRGPRSRDLFRRAEMFAGKSGALGTGICRGAGELGAARA